MRKTLPYIFGWLRNHSSHSRTGNGAVRHESPPAPHLKLYERLGVSPSLNYPNTTLAHVLDQTASRFGESPALMFGSLKMTYQELLKWVNRLAGGLARRVSSFTAGKPAG